MKISLSWIQDYIDVDLPVSRLIEVLDNIGLLIEDWEEKNGDVILDVETYANRPDTLGHKGIARELSAALGLPFKERRFSLTEGDENISDEIDVQIWEEDLCPRYCGMIVKNIKVGPSPRWLIKKIAAMDLNPVNNVVDVTNYVLFSTAQPIHAFDLAKIAGKKIIVRRAKQGEKLLSLEAKNVDLTPEMLVIADEEKPVALAGVIGGENTAVSESTQNVFIESAYFDPVSVRKQAKRQVSKRTLPTGLSEERMFPIRLRLPGWLLRYLPSLGERYAKTSWMSSPNLARPKLLCSVIIVQLLFLV